MTATIEWPAGFAPHESDNFVSNEILVRGTSAAQLWSLITDTAAWRSIYPDMTGIDVEGGGTRLTPKTAFRFETFGHQVAAEIVEFVEPSSSEPGRLAWQGHVAGDAAHMLDVHHGWLFEVQPDGAIRVLTEETQIGAPARALAELRPDPLYAAHQLWIEQLAKAAGGIVTMPQTKGQR